MSICFTGFEKSFNIEDSISHTVFVWMYSWVCQMLRSIYVSCRVAYRLDILSRYSPWYTDTHAFIS